MLDSFDNQNESFAGIYRKRVNAYKGATRTLLRELISNCNYADNPNFVFENQNYPLKRGQRVTSLPDLHDDTGLSIQQIRTALKKLSDDKIITNESVGLLRNRARLITILNIDFWLVKATDPITDEITDQATDPITDIPTSNIQTGQAEEDSDKIESTDQKTDITTDQKTDMLTAINKEITNKEITNKEEQIYLSKFLIFWEKYPEKKAKAKCEAKYKILYKRHDEIMQGLEVYLGYFEFLREQKKKDPKVFIPNYLNPLTFLGQERWKDEYSGLYLKKIEAMKREKQQKQMEAINEERKRIEMLFNTTLKGVMNKKYGENWSMIKEYYGKPENIQLVQEKFKTLYPVESKRLEEINQSS